MKRFEIKQWYEAKECECGGVFTEIADGFTYASYPAQRDYKCNKCGMVKRLHEREWPHIETEIQY